MLLTHSVWEASVRHEAEVILCSCFPILHILRAFAFYISLLHFSIFSVKSSHFPRLSARFVLFFCNTYISKKLQVRGCFENRIKFHPLSGKTDRNLWCRKLSSKAVEFFLVCMHALVNNLSIVSRVSCAQELRRSVLLMFFLFHSIF